MLPHRPISAEPVLAWLRGRTSSERAIIAQLWKLEPPERETPELMAAAMLRPERVLALVESLGPHEREALAYAQAQGGQIAAPPFEREYGRIRTHADYPNPRAYLLALAQPPSAVERLYILGLLQAEHDGLRRRYAITPDLAPLLPQVDVRPLTMRVPASQPPEQERPGDMRAFERALVGLLRLAQEGQLEAQRGGGLKKSGLVALSKIWGGPRPADITREDQWPYARFVRQIASDAGLLREDAGGGLRPTREALAWMRQPAGARARQLLDTWAASGWDELTALLGHRVQNTFRRNAQAGKRAFLELLRQLPADAWVALGDVSGEVRRVAPDFARPDGDYQAWRITSRLREPLDGFEHWERVEGELIRAMLWRSLHWLGLVDIGRRGDAALIRLSDQGRALLHGGEPADDESPALVAQPNFEVLVSARAAPATRFQLGRVAEIVRDEPSGLFRLTRRSLHAALERGIALSEVVAFLEREAGCALPQNVGVTLREWADEYGRITIRSSALLEADSPATLEQIRRDKRVRLPALAQLGAHTWAIAPADAAGLAERLRKAGYAVASDVGRPSGMPLSERDLTVIYAALMFYAQAGAQLGYDHDASGALLQRVARLLPEQQLNRAFQQRDDAIRRLVSMCAADPAAD